MEHKIQTRQKWVMLYKKVNTPRTKGFVERFNRTVLDIFFRIAFRAKSYESIEALQEDLDAWLVSVPIKVTATRAEGLLIQLYCSNPKMLGKMPKRTSIV